MAVYYDKPMPTAKAPAFEYSGLARALTKRATSNLESARKGFYEAMAQEKAKQKLHAMANNPNIYAQLWPKSAYMAEDNKEPMDDMAREREELRKKAAAIDRMCNPKPQTSDRPKLSEHWLKVLPCKHGTLENCNVCGHKAEPVSAVQTVTNETHYTVRCTNGSCAFHNFHDLTKYPNKEHAIRHWNSVNSMDLKTVKKSLVICGESGYICTQCGKAADYSKQLCKKCATQTPF